MSGILFFIFASCEPLTHLHCCVIFLEALQQSLDGTSIDLTFRRDHPCQILNRVFSPKSSKVIKGSLTVPQKSNYLFSGSSTTKVEQILKLFLFK